jgi:hypothetical protein
VVGPGGIGFLTGVASVSAGAYHTAAVKADGSVWAWGDTAIGDGTTTGSRTPVRVVGPGGTGFLAGVASVCVGDYHTVAVKTDGTVWAWGEPNWYGALGDGTHLDRLTPVQVLGPGGAGFLTGVASATAGASHTVALKTDGTVWAWGNNWYGELGDGTDRDRSIPVQVLGPGGSGFLTGVASISAEDYHTVALKTDGTVWAWGANFDGQLGDNTTTNRAVPVQVVGPGGTGFLAGVSSVAGGGAHTVAVKADGTVWCWGKNDSGQIGDRAMANSTVPVQVLQSAGGVPFLASAARGASIARPARSSEAATAAPSSNGGCSVVGSAAPGLDGLLFLLAPAGAAIGRRMGKRVRRFIAQGAR